MDITINTAQRQASRSSVLLAILLIVFGILAIALPMMASIGVVRVLSWLLLFGGIAQLVYALRSEGIGQTTWKFLVAILYIAVGGYLLANPLLGLVSLTLLLAMFFFLEGAMDIVTFAWTQRGDGSGWLLLHGVVTLLLGFMIWRHWPSSSLWTVGTLVGVSMLLTGMTRFMIAINAR
ncbi:MAG TPA: DUF308 domain-containing protein [Terriglobales bacterium]|nr:DUF308 domain-containing protein [Terriglobales bacterium]